MRLEFLFQQRRHHALDDSPAGVRAALQSLLDVLSLTARSDLKSEVIKDIQEQQTALTRAPDLLQGMDARQTFSRLHEALKGVQRLPSHFAGSSLRSHEFLDAIAKRSAIPGGAAPFDMPALHRWLGEPAIRVRADLDRWFAHFAPYETAIATCLDVLRHCGADEPLVAGGGVHLHVPKAAHQLLRVKVASDSGMYPEISAGRYRYSLRFMRQPDVDSRASQVTQDVPFLLQCCLIA
jgi:cell division protein ZapD